MAVMSWIFLYFHPLSKQWGGQPGLSSVPSSTAAAASSKMRLNCDSSPGFAIPSNEYSLQNVVISVTACGMVSVSLFYSMLCCPSLGRQQE